MNWTTFTQSPYPWERDALEYIKAQFPNYEPYRAWSNFEFIADDGSINEVDLLVFTSVGFFLVEIKSNPGRLSGDASTWTWEHEGRLKTVDNPLFRTNLKAKKLSSLLQRQKVARGKGKATIPFVEALVFCSAEGLQLDLRDNAATRVCLRDRPETADRPARPGIMAAIMKREGCQGLDARPRGIHDRPAAKLVSQALEQAGIRQSQAKRTVSEYTLTNLIGEGPGYQDWEANHSHIESSRRRIRLYLVRHGATPEERDTVARAAKREFQLLEMLNHPGILRAQNFVDHELGSALIFEHNPDSLRLDHFLAQQGEKLPLESRIDLLRQLSEVVKHAHEKRVVHRALSPQSILVVAREGERPSIRVYNWQVGFRTTGATGASTGQVTATSHIDRLVEDATTAYMAPEAFAELDTIGEQLDIFSLGALAYLLFSGVPPAANGLELVEKLRQFRGLQISAVLNGADEKLQELIQFSTHPEVINRVDSAVDFLALLDDVEDHLTTPEHELVEDPTSVQMGGRLPHGLTVKKRLGQGGCSVALLVERNGEEFVLKAASSPDHNDRLKGEGEVLQKLRHELIVNVTEVLTIGERTCILMHQAGDATLGQRLRKEGRLHVDLLERFGEDLLKIVHFLEEQGIAHRDIKPDNIGVGPVGSGKTLHLILFDFSLSRTSAENIHAGTSGYLDPLLPLRKPRRWDLHAERYAAAMTLYECATGTLARWGDGVSDPSCMLKGTEITLEPEQLEPALREPLTEFFQIAFRRDIAKRFDNAEEMLRAWRKCFEGIEDSQVSTDHDSGVSSPLDFSDVTMETTIYELGLGTRATNALDRANIVTVADLLTGSIRNLQRLPGVGNKTRRAIVATVYALQKQFKAQTTSSALPAISTGSTSSGEIDDAFRAGVDVIADRLLRTGASGNETEKACLHALLGLDDQIQSTWPRQAEIAERAGVSRQRIAQILAAFQQRWAKHSALTQLRAEIAEMLSAQAGAMTVTELSEAILAARGSSADGRQRSRLALAVLRAAVEVEKSLAEPRFVLAREAETAVVALTPELATYAFQLGKRADEIASEDPLLAPTRTLQQLREVPTPQAEVAITDNRLLRLATAASGTAALSSRQEIYPRRMAPERALRLSQGALYGSPRLTPQQIQDRVASRYPEAAPLPAGRELDELLRQTGSEFRFDPADQVYILPQLFTGAITSDSTAQSRQHTSLGSAPNAEITPEIADARQFEERLQRAAKEGAFLALTVAPKQYEKALAEIARRFPIEVVDVEQVLIEALQEVAAQAKVDWNLVLRTDAYPGGEGWDKLLLLVGRAIPRVEERLRALRTTGLLIYAGILARYEQVVLLERLRDLVGRRDGIPGLWILVPGDSQAFLEDRPVPIVGPGQRARIPEQWITNAHRSQSATDNIMPISREKKQGAPV